MAPRLPPCLPLSLPFFILQSVFEQGCPTPYRTVATRYLQNGISSFFILQNYSNRGLRPDLIKKSSLVWMRVMTD